MTRQEAAVIARAARMAKQPPLHTRFWSKVNIKQPDECWEWIAAPRDSREGYGAFWLDGRQQNSNRIAWRFTYGDIPEGLHVCHKCDNPKCCNPHHLFLGTHIENNTDKVIKKRHSFGSKNGCSKLNDEQALFIKQSKGHVSAKNLAIMFNVSAATIYDVWNRRWLHLGVCNG